MVNIFSPNQKTYWENIKCSIDVLKNKRQISEHPQSSMYQPTHAWELKVIQAYFLQYLFIFLLQVELKHKYRTSYELFSLLQNLIWELSKISGSKIEAIEKKTCGLQINKVLMA